MLQRNVSSFSSPTVLKLEGMNLTSNEGPKLASSVRLSEIIKTAADDGKMSKYHGKIERRDDGAVDLISEMKKHPNALWIKVKAIEADRKNDNGDYFSREELLKSYRSFEGVPVFTNHENNKIEKAKGKVILAEWNEEENAVYCTMFVDRDAYPDICRLIETGIATDVSMGTQVDYSVCSVCKTRAKTEAEYCNHLKTMKGRSFEGKDVYEENYGLKFIEISIVTDGACKDCTIREIIDPQEILHQAQHEPMLAAASIHAVMTKIGNEVSRGICSFDSGLNKYGGQAEIQKLNEAMNNIEEVVRTMLDQRQYIDLEFVSNVVEVMKDLQHVTDELVDQGYGSVGNQPAAAGGQMQIPPFPEQQGAGASMAPTPVESGATGVGTVTEPVQASQSEDRKTFAVKKIKDLRESLEKIYEEAISNQGGTRKVATNEKYKETIKKLASVWENPSVKEFKTEISEGNWRIVIGGKEVYGLLNGQKVASLNISELDNDIRDMLEENPRIVGENMLNALKTKVAEKAPTNTANQLESTQERQLAMEKPPLHPRVEEIRESTTEKQLDEKHTGYDTHTRKDDPKHTVTENQLNDVPSKNFDRQGVDKKNEEITELQLRDEGIKSNTNPAGDKERAAGVSDQQQVTTEGQLRQWESAEKTHSPKHDLTEEQLGEQGEPWGRRISSKEDARKALIAAKCAMAKTCLATGVTPDEVIAIGMGLYETPKVTVDSMAKIETLASNKEERTSILKRAAFHGKNLNAPKQEIESFLMGSLSDTGMCPEVSIKALQAFASSNDPISAIEEQIKLEVEALKSKKVEAQVDFFKEALADSGDEPVRIDLNIKEVDAKPDAENFTQAAFEAATKVAGQHGIKVTKTVSVEQEGQTVRVSVAGIKMTDEEQKKFKEARKEVRKQVVAQMPSGGGLPGGAPAGGPMGGGGGTTMPTPMPGDPAAGAPVSALAGEPMPDAAAEEGEGAEGEAVPPGSICPVCGNEDVDVKSGDFQCNSCGAAGEMSFVVKVHTFPGVIEEKGPSALGKEDLGEDIAEEGGIGDMMGGPGAAMPEMGGGAGAGMGGPEAGGVGGVAASFRVTPEMVKIAGEKPIGSICPHCGAKEVKLAYKKGTGIGRCHNCSNPYRVDMKVDSDKNLWARVAWKTKKKAEKKEDRKERLLSALKSQNLSEKFASSSFEEKATIIASLHDKGIL